MDVFAKSFCKFCHHNPFLILGFLFWIVLGWSSSHVLLKLVRAGHKNDTFGMGKLIIALPRGYLRVRAAHRWPAWPAHLIWISAIGGFVSLAVGLLRFIP